MANITFIVPGSEDTFNNTRESLIRRYDSFMKVYEAEVENAAGGQLGKDKKSHGQILFDFINDLLDNKTAANFDEQRRILLKKYFEPYGLKIVDKGKTPPPIIKQPECDPKTIFWSTYTGGFQDPVLTGFKGCIYAIPLDQSSPGNVSSPKHKMLFVHLLRKIPTTITGIRKECYYVKFLFDSTEMINKYKSGKPGYNISTDWSLNNQLPQNVYYGIMTKPSGSKFTLVYANVANKNKPGEIYGIKDGFKVSSSPTITGPNGDITVFEAVLMEAATGTGSALPVNTDFSKDIKGEYPNHADNLAIESTDPNFSGPLLTQLVKKIQAIY